MSKVQLRQRKATRDARVPVLANQVAASPDMTGKRLGQLDTMEPDSSQSFAQRFAHEMGPSLVSAAVMLSLIFGGCCSNVYALEAIINFEPSSGTLLTFVQFLFVAVTGYIAQYDRNGSFGLAPNKVPLRRWIVNIILFFTINVLNNHAFSYDISVPVHIILRSGGSITTMAAGYLYGKRYTRMQIIAVILLTLGVIMAAWSDAQAKGSAEKSGRPAFSTGLIILFVAQILSAIMGLYTEATYVIYGPQWRENLFYSHALSLPLFIPFAPSMVRNLAHLSTSTPMQFPGPLSIVSDMLPIPSQLIYLVTNVLTQYACIRGVNLLAALSTALTVTIVLNIRKLVSLLLSIWLFGNRLAPGTMVGAIIVFSAGGLYTVGTKRKVEEPAKAVDEVRDGKAS
ncbi:UAA transporter family-domain-containing protein [Mariannaea sp. PMI_226]|nr:UAA transporter family-domain-containing protein [Mariannaea sp. PMI_226]